MPLRPQREELIRHREIRRLGQGVHGEQRRRKNQEQEPQRCRQVSHHAAHEHGTVRDMQSLQQEQPEVHQISLTPAAVALQFVDEVRRHLLVAAAEIVDDPHRPARAAHECSLDEIV